MKFFYCASLTRRQAALIFPFAVIYLFPQELQYGKDFQKKYTKTCNIYADRGDYSAIWVIGAVVAAYDQWNCFSVADYWLGTILFFHPTFGQFGNIGVALPKVVPATYFDCMVSFLHATVLGMGNFGNAGWDANIQVYLI